MLDPDVFCSLSHSVAPAFSYSCREDGRHSFYWEAEPEHGSWLPSQSYVSLDRMLEPWCNTTQTGKTEGSDHKLVLLLELKIVKQNKSA